MSKQLAVYMLANRERGTLYVGVTGNLKLRIWEHREGMVAGFTSRYGVKRLVWYERFPDFPFGNPSREADQEVESCMEARFD